MRDVNDDRVMTDFLLGKLDGETREQIFDRLGSDEAYFETMAALEDDLILRWHRGELPPDERELFAMAYADPARQARVDAALPLLHAAEAWKAEPQPTSFAARLIARLPRLPPVPRFALAGAAIALVAGLSLWMAWPAGDPFKGTPATGTYAVTLTAIGEKGTPSAGFDRLDLPRGKTVIELTVVSSSIPADARLTAQILDRDRGTVLALDPPIVRRSNAVTNATVSVAAANLPDGDYVLTMRRDASAGGELMATQSFRMARRQK